jgi:hypothetical protein
VKSGLWSRYSARDPQPVWNLPCARRERQDNVAQRIVEMLIGRLITDEQFRKDFLRDPEQTLLNLCDIGLELSRTEIAALMNTDPTLWGRTADAIDPRLQKASLKNESRAS